jgi:ABC-2 type transport system permease protein
MIGGTLIETAHNARNARGRSARRIASLARAEAMLLRRNLSALATALLGPVILVVVPFTNGPESRSTDGSGAGAFVVAGLTAFAMIYGVYYNLVTALVARREERVLKRLRTGELGDAEIIAGTAAPAVAVAWSQIILGIVAAYAFLGMGAPTNPALVLAAVVLGTAVFVLLAAASTAPASTVQTAQLTATPVLLVFTVLSGAMVPLRLLPEPVHWIAQALPVARMVELVRLGLTGTTADGATVGFAGSFGPAAVPLLILTAWIAASAWATRRWFRWDPRR